MCLPKSFEKSPPTEHAVSVRSKIPINIEKTAINKAENLAKSEDYEGAIAVLKEAAKNVSDNSRLNCTLTFCNAAKATSRNCNTGPEITSPCERGNEQLEHEMKI